MPPSGVAPSGKGSIRVTLVKWEGSARTPAQGSTPEYMVAVKIKEAISIPGRLLH